ncbi:MAG TPA: ATP-dependent DNA ligase, partial [Candidatus Binataceae bacterium]|nr:ATP-dependent DNA ligase [Candidatus Binataceae bacterium]
ASFLDFATVCQELGQTQSRIQMAESVASLLGALEAGEAEIAARFMVGRAVAQGDEKRLQISGRAIWKIAAAISGAEDQGEDIFTAAEDFGAAIEMTLRLRAAEPEPSLTIAEVDRAFGEIAEIEGRHARARKLERLTALFERASNLEAKFIAKILIREMRHGVSEGLMLEAIARMAHRPVAEVRRLNMLEGDIGRVVRIVREGGPAADPGAAPARAAKPLRPMLAQPAADVAEAFAMIGPEVAFEHKLDGARVQIHHLAGGATKIFSRKMNDITPSLPEITELIARLGARTAILDGEVVAIDTAGRPRAFQELMRRFGRVREIEKLRAEQPVRLYLFDILGLDGALVIDRPYHERVAMLRELAAAANLELVGRIERPSLSAAEKFYADAIAGGFEGVVAKSLASAYTPGARGRGWLKIKQVRTLDLVIVAAQWGYGRRHGWLSNFHLAARNERSGAMVEVGKTFKGPTDAEFEAITERLLALKTEEAHGIVRVRPELVVEVGYNDIQRSPRYPGGMTPRFARIIRIRDDKRAAEADTIETIAREFERQSVAKPGMKI